MLTLARATPSGASIRLAVNLSAEARAWSPDPPWRLLLDSEAPAFGGRSAARPLAPWQVLLYDAGG